MLAQDQRDGLELVVAVAGRDRRAERATQLVGIGAGDVRDERGEGGGIGARVLGPSASSRAAIASPWAATIA